MVADGAIGTMIQQLASSPVECVESVNLNRPGPVAELHKQYVQAGSEIIKTNTFGANRFILEKFGLQNMTAEINRQEDST